MEGDGMKLKSLLMLFVLLPVAAQASTITVGPVGYDYVNIQDAVEGASPGDVIEVYSGTYYENVNVTKLLTLRGQGMPIIDAGGSGNAIILNADGVTLEGFIATNAGEKKPGIWVLSSGNVIRRNIVNDNDVGFFIETADNCIITGNDANNNGMIGIGLTNSNENTISDNNVSNNGR
ncbi:MAG: hypothetical protein D4Q77_01270, partial [Methanothrix sp.]